VTATRPCARPHHPIHPACFTVPERDTDRAWIASDGRAVRTVC